MQLPCTLCGKPARARDGICPACIRHMPLLPGSRCRCGLPLTLASAEDDQAPLCGRCLERPPPFNRVDCGFAWRFPVDRLISRYKYRGRLYAERPLLTLWQHALQAHPPTRPDALVPIPLHWRRQWWRGFNQSQRLAQGLGRQLGLPVSAALARQRATPRQQGLRQSTRRRNLRHAFRVVIPVEGLHLALVDDVVTTGSTTREAAEALLGAGARRVDVWALARVMPGSDQP